MYKRTLTILFVFVAMLFSFATSNIADAEVDQSILESNEKWTGDFDGMVERHLIRALVPYSKTFYFLDGGDQRGLTYESLVGFDKYVNKQLGKKTMTIRLVVIPTTRDRLLPGLVEGIGDIAAGNLTITPDRQNWLISPIPVIRMSMRSLSPARRLPRSKPSKTWREKKFM